MEREQGQEWELGLDQELGQEQGLEQEWELTSVTPGQFFKGANKMEIKRPDWGRMCRTTTPGWNEFDEWFDENVEPINKMLREGVEVYKKPGGFGVSWVENKHDAYGRTHKGLLINIQPIKKETAEDVLEEFVWAVEHKDDVKIWDECYQRAKRVLEEK